MSDEAQHSHSGGFLTSRSGRVMIGFLVIVTILLFTEHRAHVLGVLPYLLLLACPLMHFMHGGHHHHHEGGADQRPREGKPQ